MKLQISSRTRSKLELITTSPHFCCSQATRSICRGRKNPNHVHRALLRAYTDGTSSIPAPHVEGYHASMLWARTVAMRKDPRAYSAMDFVMAAPPGSSMFQTHVTGPGFAEQGSEPQKPHRHGGNDTNDDRGEIDIDLWLHAPFLLVAGRTSANDGGFVSGPQNQGIQAFRALAKSMSACVMPPSLCVVTATATVREPVSREKSGW